MPSLCQDIANEYNELIKLRDAFLIEHNICRNIHRSRWRKLEGLRQRI
ncbi:MAG: hypothetical protein AAB886_00570 [Patescibacteria group bacterium]